MWKVASASAVIGGITAWIVGDSVGCLVNGLIFGYFSGLVVSLGLKFFLFLLTFFMTRIVEDVEDVKWLSRGIFWQIVTLTLFVTLIALWVGWEIGGLTVKQGNRLVWEWFY